MHVIPLRSLIIPKARQRQEFDAEALAELTQSIDRLGLMHAPVVRKVGEDFQLVSGERRIRAIEDLWMTGGTLRFGGETFNEGHIPVVSMGELDPLTAWEAELDENFKRRDLTWQEHAEALQKLYSLREAQAKANAPSPEVAPTFTHSDLAEELVGTRDGGPANAIRKELIVARHLEDPDVAKAKSADDAFKILVRKEQQRKNVEAAASFDATAKGEVPWTLLQGNCLELLGNGLPHKFDVILTDPPYGMGADAFGDAAGKLLTIDHGYKDDLAHWTALMAQWCPLAFGAAAPQAHAYVFCDIDNFQVLREMMAHAGWRVFRTPLVVYKINSGRVPWPQHGPRRSWEAILYAVKGDKPVNIIAPDVIPCRGDDNLGHGAQKPVELYVELLKRSCRPGDRVLDSFAGTGTIFAAAKELKLYATGIEQDANSFGICLNRLKELGYE